MKRYSNVWFWWKWKSIGKWSFAYFTISITLSRKSNTFAKNVSLKIITWYDNDLDKQDFEKESSKKYTCNALFEKFYLRSWYWSLKDYGLQIMNFDTNWILCLIIAYSFLESSYSEVRNRNKRFRKFDIWNYIPRLIMCCFSYWNS